MSGISDAVKVAAGGYHGIALHADGTVATWGLAANGELGNGSATNKTTPVAVSSLSGIASIDGGYAVSVATGADGVVHTFGFNAYGQLGDGTTTDRYTPVTIGVDLNNTPVTSSFVYAADGLRTSKTAGSATTSFVWDHSAGVAALLTETVGAATTSYLYGPDGVAYEQISSSGTVSYLHHDQLGSTRLVTDTTAAVTGSASFDPYGNPTGTTGTTPNLGWAGQYRDTETGLIYMRARYYDPTTTQFLTRDPLEAMTRSAYGYVGGNPLNRTDPSGLFWGEGTLSNVGSAIGSGVSAAGDFVYRNSGTLSTVTSGLATVAYATCAATAGAGCGVGLALSGASTVFAGVNAYRACVGGQGDCTSAAVGLGISLAATGVGALAQRAAAGALGNVFNSYARDIYLARQAGVIGGIANLIATIGGVATSFWGSRSGAANFDLALAGCGSYV